MSNSLAVTEYHLSFFSEKEKFLVITEDQYHTLKTLANSVKFVEINGGTYNVSDIKEMKKVIKEPPYMTKIGDRKFYSQKEVDDYLG